MGALKASTIIGGDVGNRNPFDLYDTPKDVTTTLMNFLDLPIDTPIWDPAVGNYALINAIEDFGHTVTYGSDIQTGNDFLTTKLLFDIDWIITNPPFNLAEQFIRRCLQFDPKGGFALLLKSTYWHSKKRYKLFLEQRPTYVCPLLWRPNFAPDRGKSPTMDFMWCVWDKEDFKGQTIYYPLRRLNG